MVYFKITDICPGFIKQNIMEDILELERDTIDLSGTTSYDILDKNEKSSLAIIYDHVAQYFDWDKLISGPFQSETFSNLLRTILIYKLETRIAPDKVSDIRVMEFKAAMFELKEIKIKNEVPRDWPIRNNEYDISDTFIWSSDEKVTG